MKQWKIVALSLGLSVVLCACSMGAAGGIGTDGAVQVGGNESAVVSEQQTPQQADPVQAPAEVTENAAQAPAETTEEPVQEQEKPNLEGLEEFEEPGAPDTTELDLDSEPKLPLGGSIFTDIPQQGNPTLDEVLNSLADPQTAAEISAYYAEKAKQAAEQGQTVTTEVQYNKGAVLSVLRTLKDSAGTKTLFSETFSTANAGLYTLSNFFPGIEESVWKKTVIDGVCGVLNTSGKELYAEWKTYASNSFDPDNYYLTSDGLCIYYQAGVISLASQTVTVPYSRLTGFVMQGQ